MESVTYSKCADFYNSVHRDPVLTLEWFSVTLSKDATLTLLYYAGYLTMTVCYFYPMVLSVLISAKIDGRFKIPNREVMADWARWIIDSEDSAESCNDILSTCVEGPICDFEAKWPNFMQQFLNPKLVEKTRCAISRKTPEKIYHVLFLGLMQSLKKKGWEVIVEARAGGDYVDLRLLHKPKRKAVLIELKSSEKEGDLERDANRALEQIVKKNYRNPEGLWNVQTLREYGIAGYHLSSCVKGRSLKLKTGTDEWVEEDEVRGRGALSQGCRTESSCKSKKRKGDGTGADGGRARKCSARK
jgi:PD-(D/E)XK nuclease superfamily